ncbi:MAG: hypothetical protein HY866_18750 [Chloroflexi bacterium]|nr:hypothetical protein [Chloroflexota bacterium]
MAFVITQLPNRPILWVAVEVPVEDYLSSYRMVNHQLTQIITQADKSFHIWIDASELNLSFSDVILGTQAMAQHKPEAFRSPLARWAVIGTHPLIEIAIRRMDRDLGLHMKQFVSLEDALTKFDNDLSHAVPSLALPPVNR